MTEAEWLAAPDPGPMLDYLLRPASPRKLRLFAAACCRRVEHLLLTAEGRGAVDVAERNADGQAEQGEVTAAVAALDEDAVAEAGPGAGRFVFDRRAEAVAAAVSSALLDPKNRSPGGHSRAHEAAERAAFASLHAGHAGEGVAQVALARDVFGNPFRPVAFAPEWRTNTAVSLARQMYEARDFSAMPILADALQDAGCESADILSHCRGEGPHVRGCWVCDLVLGKE